LPPEILVLLLWWSSFFHQVFLVPRQNQQKPKKWRKMVHTYTCRTYTCGFIKATTMLSSPCMISFFVTDIFFPTDIAFVPVYLRLSKQDGWLKV
jgi:hypothetical protein